MLSEEELANLAKEELLRDVRCASVRAEQYGAHRWANNPQKLVPNKRFLKHMLLSRSPGLSYSKKHSTHHHLQDNQNHRNSDGNNDYRGRKRKEDVHDGKHKTKKHEKHKHSKHKKESKDHRKKKNSKSKKHGKT